MTTIREARRGDEPALRAILRRIDDDNGAAAEPAAIDRLAALLADPPPHGPTALVVEEDGALVGAAVLSPIHGSLAMTTIWWLEDIWLVPEARGRGLGERAMRAIARAARERGIRRLEWVTTPSNTRAQAFYERLGAKRQDCLLYALDLDP